MAIIDFTGGHYKLCFLYFIFLPDDTIRLSLHTTDLGLERYHCLPLFILSVFWQPCDLSILASCMAKRSISIVLWSACSDGSWSDISACEYESYL